MSKRILFTPSFFLTLIFTFAFSPTFFTYASAPIKILIVPGHDNASWGALYGNLKEADMTLVLGTQLFNILKQDKRFDVHITRDSFGYTAEFANYFATQAAAINTFRTNAKQQAQTNIQNGTFVLKNNGIIHNTVTQSVSDVLYGINKWADDNKMDAVIHIHFNDYPRPSMWAAGIYRGFAVYMPEAQMANAKTSDVLAKSIFTQLHAQYITSNYPEEKGGLVPDQSLIALGASGTLLSTVHSVLIEYGYIYRFGNTIFRHQSYTTMANLTATGIKNYFFK